MDENVSAISTEILSVFLLRRMDRFGEWVKNEFGQLGDRTTQTVSPCTSSRRECISNPQQAESKQCLSKGMGRSGGWGKIPMADWEWEILHSKKPTSACRIQWHIQGNSGYYHTLFLKTNSSLWAMGYNGLGQLGINSTSTKHSPVQVVGTGVANISAGEWHSAFVKTDGSLWVMGDNRYGQLGTGDFISSLVPVQIISSGVSQVSCGKYYTFIK